MVKKITILSTKKLLPSQKQAVLNANFAIVEEDFITVSYKKNISFLDDLGRAIIFPSQNAVYAVLDSQEVAALKQKKVFCVGIKTKELLEKNGFTVIESADYALDLSKIIIEKYNKERFTFFCGNLRRDDLPNALKNNNIYLTEIEIYQTILSPKKTINTLDAILFFSPSGVESYLQMNTISDEICFCIGTTTAQVLKNKKIKNIIIAKKPSVENVIDKLMEYYSSLTPEGGI